MSGNTLTTKRLRALLEQQQYRCALTGWMLTPETSTLDHRVPLAKGGSHVLENCQIVDWRANRAKGTMAMDEFVEMCVAVAEWAKTDSHREPFRVEPSEDGEQEIGGGRAVTKLELLDGSIAGVERRLAGEPGNEHLRKSLEGMKKTRDKMADCHAGIP